MADPLYYIELVTYTPLARENVSMWLATVTELLPTGMVSTVGGIRDKNMSNVRVIYRKTTNGKHKYIIPLVRNLTEDEFEKITNYVVSTDEQFEINTSETKIQTHYQLPRFSEMISQEHLDSMAEDIARIQHNNWKDEKASKGWQYSVQYNGLEKQSPMIKDWKELPEKTKYVDKRLPKEIINIIESYGYSIVANETLDAILSKYDNKKSYTNKESK